MNILAFGCHPDDIEIACAGTLLLLKEQYDIPYVIGSPVAGSFAVELIKAIKENTALGSGLKIAMKDLEMRGAGNILGLSQSGHIDAVGYDFYIKLLLKRVHIHEQLQVLKIQHLYLGGEYL